MPFGEVIPFRGLLDTVTSLPSLQPVNFTPGHEAVVFRVGKIRLGDVICYEVGFDGLVSSEVAAGANLLTVQTNDADFELDGQTGETLQQLDMARIRAIEHDRAVVVASTTGISAIIAPDGSLLASSRMWQQAEIEAQVPLRTATTLADRVGGWPEGVITLATVAALALALTGLIRERRRSSRRSPAGSTIRACPSGALSGSPPGMRALLAGAIPVLAFPAANLEFLAWFGLVPGLALMRAAATRREAAVRGWWFGAGYLLAAMYWLAPNLGPGLLLVAIVLGVLWSVVGIATWSLLRPPVTGMRALAALAVVPSCWLLGEWIRSWQGIGGPWAVLGASQWQHPAILALAAVGGIWLVSFALVTANTGLLVALVAKTPVIRLAGVGGALVAIGGRSPRLRADRAGAGRPAADDRAGPAGHRCWPRPRGWLAARR